MQKSCLVLFSGGLDSILACKVLQEQGIKVVALKFISPFFSYDLKDEKRKREAQKRVLEKYDIFMDVVDITDPYLKMVVNPPHGYGKYLNPCIDCKILMVKKALSLLKEYGASFIATGEVLGQRPMSQRRDTLRIIERDSGAEGILLRPLSARHLKETRPEREGIVNRELLPMISGRSRKPQIELAKKYGIKEYPAPAGGCVLADPILSKRFKRIFETWPDFNAHDLILAQVGRHMLLPGGSWLIVGRNQAENQRLKEVAMGHEIFLKAADRPGPLALIPRLGDNSDLDLAAKIVLRYSREKEVPGTVTVWSSSGGHDRDIQASVIAQDDLIKGLMI